MIQTKIRKCFSQKQLRIKDGFIQITIPPGAYEIESLSDEITRSNIEESCFTEADCPFTMKPNFSTVGCITKICR